MEGNPNDPIWSPQFREANHLPPLHPADLQRLQWGPQPQQDNSPILPTPISAPMPTGGGMPIGDVLPFLHKQARGDLGLNVLFVGVLWEVWICLYPLSALAGLLTLTNGMPLLRSLLPDSPIIGPGLYAVVLGSIAALVVLWNVSRLEHTLARNTAYRVLRHVVRIPLLGLAAVVAIEEYQGFPYDPSPAAITRILQNPVNLALVVAAMIAAHFTLWNWKKAREFWHRRLEGANLRKRLV
jgi:hypothetical protein